MDDLLGKIVLKINVSEGVNHLKGKLLVMILYKMYAD
jgi:hypothetical protein